MEPSISEQRALLPAPEIGKLIPDISYQTYADSEGINASGLKEILRSPAHYWQSRLNRDEDSDALQFGKLFHYAVLEPKLFQERRVVRPKVDRRTSAGKLADEAFEASLKPTDIVVPEKWVKQLEGMANSLLNHKRGAKLLELGVAETCLWWEDPATKELCKMRPDFVTSPSGHIVDLKTTKDASEHAFSRDVYKYKYFISAAHYMEGARVTGVARSDSFIFVAVEKEPPFAIAIYPSGMSVLGVGEQWRSKAMATYAKCKKESRWPGYNEEARLIELPPWAEAVDPEEED